MLVENRIRCGMNSLEIGLIMETFFGSEKYH
jgi:hypothetical protein